METYESVCLFEEVLIIVSRLYKVVVYVHFEGEKSIVYRDEKVKEKNGPGLDIQCLGGVHYNWMMGEKDVWAKDSGREKYTGAGRN